MFPTDNQKWDGLVLAQMKTLPKTIVGWNHGPGLVPSGVATDPHNNNSAH